MSSSNKFRIAVCFSGQARHWKSCVENIKRFFVFDVSHPVTGQDIETDFFIHTWDTNTWRNPKEDHSVFRNEKHNDKDDIINVYRPKGFEQEEWIPENFKLAWDPMFYSFEKSLMLKRRYELENDFQYDIVIKARLDVIYDPTFKFPLFERVWPGICYPCTPVAKFQSEFNYNNFDDVMFYGDSPTMDLMSDLYAAHKSTCGVDYREENHNSMNLDPVTFYGPGCLLYDHATNLSIHPDGGRPINYAVVRSTAVDEKLDGIYDYEEIRKKWFDWYI
jgi:hypothetical protein